MGWVKLSATNYPQPRDTDDNILWSHSKEKVMEDPREIKPENDSITFGPGIDPEAVKKLQAKWKLGKP